MAGEGKGSGPRWWIWPTIFGLVFVAWLVVGFGTFWIVPKLNGKRGIVLSETGTFGDTFGAVNSLFSALGVAGVVCALILQVREQREARWRADEAKHRETDLAMLAAMIQGTSSVLDSQQRSYDQAMEAMARIQDPALIARYKEVADVQHEGIQHYRSDLHIMIEYAKKEWKWYERLASSDPGPKDVR